VNLTLPQVSQLLDAPVRDVERWVSHDGLPTTIVFREHRVHRAELFDWAAARRMALPPRLFTASGVDAARCADAVRTGGVHRVEANGDPLQLADGLVRALVAQDPARSGLRSPAAALVAARPGLGFLVVDDQIALPRARYPIVANLPPTVAVCRTDGPVPELDAKVVVVVAAPTVRLQRALVEVLYCALRDPGLRGALLGTESAGRIAYRLSPRTFPGRSEAA
jgi:hypothetical protein